MPEASPQTEPGVLVGTIITCLNGAPRAQRKNGLDALDRLIEQLETTHDKSLENWHRAEALQDQLEAQRRVLVLARGLSVAVADKNIGPLSEQARGVQGAVNDVLKDLPTFEEVAGILAESNPATDVASSGSRFNETGPSVSSSADSPNGEQTREQLLERLALTVKDAIDGGGFEDTLFETQVSGVLWLLYGERSPATRPDALAERDARAVALTLGRVSHGGQHSAWWHEEQRQAGRDPASKLEIDPFPDGDPPLTNPSPATSPLHAATKDDSQNEPPDIVTNDDFEV